MEFLIFFVIWLILINEEAKRNVKLIKREEDPHNWQTYLMRLCIMILYSFILISKDYYWYWFCPYIIFSGWFFFDVDMALRLDKNIAYLGNGNIDKFQKKYMGPDIWIVIKFMLMIGTVSQMFFYGKTPYWDLFNIP